MDWQVEFYQDVNGDEPVKDFILAQPKGAIAEIIHVFKLLREFNVHLGMPYVRKMGKHGLRELRIKHGSDLYPDILLRIHREEVQAAPRHPEKRYQNTTWRSGDSIETHAGLHGTALTI